MPKAGTALPFGSSRGDSWGHSLFSVFISHGQNHGEGETGTLAIGVVKSIPKYHPKSNLCRGRDGHCWPPPAQIRT